MPYPWVIKRQKILDWIKLDMWKKQEPTPICSSTIDWLGSWASFISNWLVIDGMMMFYEVWCTINRQKRINQV